MSLNNFPMVNQLHEPTMDGAPDENSQNNCVPASLSACLEYLTGRPYDGDELKDSVYGQGYTGPMAIGEFTDYCARQGVRLSALSGDGSVLLAGVVSGINAGVPVVFTIPSQWGAEPPPTTGPTHVVAGYAVEGASLTAMNPWGGFAQSQPLSWWEPRLRMGEVWRVEHMAGTPNGWTDDGTTLTAPNHVPVRLGFRQHILDTDWNPALVPAAAEHGDAGGDTQDYSMQLHFDDASGQVQERAGAMAQAEAALIVAEAQRIQDESTIAGLQGQVTTLQAQVAQLQADLQAAGGSGSVEAIAAVKALIQAIKFNS